MAKNIFCKIDKILFLHLLRAKKIVTLKKIKILFPLVFKTRMNNYPKFASLWIKNLKHKPPWALKPLSVTQKNTQKNKF